MRGSKNGDAILVGRGISREASREEFLMTEARIREKPC